MLIWKKNKNLLPIYSAFMAIYLFLSLDSY